MSVDAEGDCADVPATGISGERLVVRMHGSGERPASNWTEPEATCARGPSSERPAALFGNIGAAIPLPEAEDTATSSGRVVESSGLGLSWGYLVAEGPFGVALQLRALVEALKALELLHLGTASRAARVHAAVCPGNLMFRNDGAAFYLLDDERQQQPTPYRAPELSSGSEANVACDVFAVGVMVLEALTASRLVTEDVRAVHSKGVGHHPSWSRHAEDPLFAVALRAIAVRPKARWSTAGEFAYALVKAGAGRIDDLPSLVHSLREWVRRSEDRVTPLMSFVLPEVAATPADEVAETIDSTELVSVLPEEPGRLRLLRDPAADDGLANSRATLSSTPSIMNLPAAAGVLDWSEFRGSEPQMEPASHDSNTLLSMDPPAQQARASSRRWAAALVACAVVFGASAALVYLVPARLHELVRAAHVTVTRLVGADRQAPAASDDSTQSAEPAAFGDRSEAVSSGDHGPSEQRALASGPEHVGHHPASGVTAPVSSDAESSGARGAETTSKLSPAEASGVPAQVSTPAKPRPKPRPRFGASPKSRRTSKATGSATEESIFGKRL